MCGENARNVATTIPTSGSSPRVRGKHRRCLDGLALSRLIPACAGKTGQDDPPPAPRPAHPRVCGENRRPVGRDQRRHGSSPRVRGKPGEAAVQGGGRRLIPACAGKTSRRSSLTGCCRAHPRVCGENMTRFGVEPCNAGSSPRVRGKPATPAARAAASGLIPACAGKTPSRCAGAPAPRAHPRVCGENGVGGEARGGGGGSSLRVRGKRWWCPRTTPTPRLIPACAGKTRCGHSPRRPGRAHPRVCGENCRGGSRTARSLGSSPRVRGKLIDGISGLVDSGLIPACAGKTQ